MNNSLIFFTEEQGNFLIRLILAQIISDFLLQTDSMVKNKKLLSVPMLLHIVVVYVSTALLTGQLLLALFIAVSHWLIDSTKVELKNRGIASDITLFVTDQLLHLAVLVIAWAWYFDVFANTGTVMMLPFFDYKISLIVLGYFMVIWPIGYLIKFATQNMTGQNQLQLNQGQNNIERGGKRIGQFERVIILTFVLLNQYEAIGFLITGKSIIRFVQSDENLRSEYVLVGTMMSYAFAILTGIIIHWLLNLA